MAIFNKPSILNEINDFVGCEVALFTTFNFDISFFDKTILPLLTKKKTRVCVFADSSKFQEAINSYSESSHIGRNYYVLPFRMNKAFHPKTILLLGKDKAKLIIASANLNYSSYYSNNEIFQSYTYSEENDSYLGLILQAFTFFRNMVKEHNDTFVDELFTYIFDNYKFLRLQSNNSLPLLVTSYDKSITSQVIEVIGDEVELIRAAVPFYDDDLAALSYLKAKYPNAKMQLFLQNQHTTFPKDRYSERLIDNLFIFDSVNNNNHSQRHFYHGKIFNFVTKNNEYVLFGSPNFSASALLRSFKNNGNMEAGILEQGERGSFDDLFNCFETNNHELELLQTRIAEDSKTVSEESVSYIRGVIKDNIIVEVLIKSTLFQPEIIFINGVQINASIEKDGGDNYLIHFPRGYLEKTVFDLTIQNSDNTASVRCFACDIQYLDLYFKSSSNNPYKNLNSEEDMEKYRKDLFFKQFEEITNDIRFGIQEQQNQVRLSVPQDVNDDTVNDESEDEEEIDSEIYETTNYVISIGNHEVFSKASAYLTYFAKKTSMLLTRKKGNGSTNREKDYAISAEENRQKRNDSSFIKTILKYFGNYSDISNRKLDDLNFSFYFNLYELFSESFISYMYLERNSGLDVVRLVDTKIDYLVNRLIPALDSQAEESEQFQYLKKEIALLCLESYLSKSANIQVLREELIKLDIRFANTFIDEIESLMREVGFVLDYRNISLIVSYFKEFIIGSPKTEELKALINGHFCFSSSDLDLKFDESESSLIINIDTFEQKDSFNGRLDITSELKNKIMDYIERYYGDKRGDKCLFEIKIHNYNEKISSINFKCDYKQYERTIYYEGRTIPSILSFRY